MTEEERIEIRERKAHAFEAIALTEAELEEGGEGEQ